MGDYLTFEPREHGGSALNPHQCEALAFTFWSRELRANEAQLYASKWFDYRALHPVKATYLFGETYRNVVREIYAEVKDRRTAAEVQAFDGDLFKQRDVGSFILARQHFDRIGVRYGFALMFIFRRFLNRGWHVFPRPNQLYAEELLLDLADAWKAECSTRLQFPTDPRFKTEHFTGHPDQVAWVDWAMDQVDARELKGRTLATYFARDLLPTDAAQQRFGSQAVHEGRRWATLLL